MKNEILSIVIPTVKYSKYIDKTLKSCIEHNLSDSFEIIVSVNNSSFEEFENCKYFNNKFITWKCLHEETIPMDESINRALEFATCDWVFILSDDDCISNKFLEGIDLNRLSINSLYATRINIIDEKDQIVSVGKKYGKGVYSADEAMDLFFRKNIHNHISLLVFNKKLLEKTGKFKIQGYPNGYYIDTVFHGKALANCDYLYTADNIVFSRRESSTQGSSKFYFDKEVNDYFNIIVDAYFEDENFKKEALKRYGSREAFYTKMIQDRFYTEWSKLNKPVYNKSLKKKLEFLYKHLRYWNTGIGFKFYSFIYILKFELVKILPQSVKNKIKKLLGR